MRGRRLGVRKETLRSLSASDLAQVSGGKPKINNCTAKLSGCILGHCDQE
jgi:hypothetical protein